MADTPVQQPASKLSSKEYLKQLRARRATRKAPPTQPITQPEPAPPTQQPNQPPVQPQPQREQPVTQPSNPPEQPPIAGAAESEVFPGQYKPLPEETVFVWKADSRPFKKRNRQFYTTVGLITMLISLILFFAGQFLPIAVVIAVAFLGYVMSSVPPETVENKITTYGIRNDDTLYYWDELGRFWFETRYDQEMVIIETTQFPGRITLVLGNAAQKDIEELLSEVLLKQKPVDTFIDKATKWLQEKIPLDS